MVPNTAREGKVPTAAYEWRDGFVGEDRFHRWAWLSLILLGLAVRAAALAAYWPQLAADPDQYRGIAENLAGGVGYCVPMTVRPTAFRPPLYPLLLAAVLSTGAGTAGIAALHLLLAATTLSLTAVCAWQLRLGWAGLVAGLLVALDPLLVSSVAQVMTETLAACVTMALLTALLWLRQHVHGEAPGAKASLIFVRVWLMGAIFGACLLCRPTFGAFGVLLVLVGWPKNHRWYLTPAGLKQLAVGVLGLTCALGPWLVRNVIVLGHPIVTTTHGGYTLLLGHNAVYDREVVAKSWGTVWPGDSLLAWQASLEPVLARDNPAAPQDEQGLVIDEIVRDRWMSRQAWTYLLADLPRAGRSALSLLGRFWNVLPAAAEGRGGRLRWAVALYYGIALTLAAIGVIRLRGQDWHLWQPLLLLLVSFTLVHAFYWADMRMRAPLSPVLALLAARAMAWKRVLAPVEASASTTTRGEQAVRMP